MESEKTGGIISERRYMPYEFPIHHRHRGLGLTKPHYFLQDDKWYSWIFITANHQQEAIGILLSFFGNQGWRDVKPLVSEWFIDRNVFASHGIGNRYVVFLVRVGNHERPTPNRSIFEGIKEPDRLVHKLFLQENFLDDDHDPKFNYE